MNEPPEQLLFDRVMKLMSWNEEKTSHWFATRNPLLGGVSPNEMLNAGRYGRLLRFIDDAEERAMPLR